MYVCVQHMICVCNGDGILRCACVRVRACVCRVCVCVCRACGDAPYDFHEFFEPRDILQIAV